VLRKTSGQNPFMVLPGRRTLFEERQGELFKAEKTGILRMLRQARLPRHLIHAVSTGSHVPRTWARYPVDPAHLGLVPAKAVDQPEDVAGTDHK
jgi:hypothetical protein